MTITIQPPVWSFNEDSTPCSCCWATNAIEGDLWTCDRTNKQWFITDPQVISRPEPHNWCECDGSCNNPLHTESNLILAQAYMRGISWGDILQIWENEQLSKLSEEEKNAIKKRQEEELAKEEALYMIEKERRRIEDSVRRHEIVANYKSNKGRKEMRPCRYLYSCNGDRKTGGARPTTLHISSECWNYEYHDPITGKLVVSHTCMHLHPGEEGWCKEWEKNRLFNPPQIQAPPSRQIQAPAHRVFHNNKENRDHRDRKPFNFRTQKPQPQQEPAKQKKNTMFDVLNDSDSD